MCRSKKDGKHGAGHKAARNKILCVNFIREGRLNRRAAKEATFREFEQAAKDAESKVQSDYFGSMEEMYEEYIGYLNRQEDDFFDHNYAYDHMDDDSYGHYDWEINRDAYTFAGDDPMEPEADLFQAIDRAVRRHGVSAVRASAPLLAAAFDVSLHEVNHCIGFTRAGYINY